MDLSWLNQGPSRVWSFPTPGTPVQPDPPSQTLAPSYPWSTGAATASTHGERVRPAQKPGIGDLDLPVRRTMWQQSFVRPVSCEVADREQGQVSSQWGQQSFVRPVSCGVADREQGQISSQWGQDYLGQELFPLSCPNLEAQEQWTAKKKASIPPPDAPAATPAPPPLETPRTLDCSDFNYEDFVKRETKLLVKIREFMESPKHNPERGSIPSERVQNCIKQKHKELYSFVVSTVYANQWHRFIRKHDTIFELIFSKDEGRSLPRIRLLAHANYEQADRREEEERRRREYVILSCLKQYLLDNNGDVRVEDFRMEYQRWLNGDPAHIRKCNEAWRRPEHPPYQEPPPPLPRFRDIIRIVKRHPKEFAYDAMAEEAGHNVRIRTASGWRPNELESATSFLGSEADKPAELQLPFSAPARMKSITFAVPPEEEIGLTIPQSGPTSRVRIGPDPAKDAKLVPDADPVWQFQERERRLVKEIVDFLDSEEWNPHHGSVPSERVQNCIKAKFPGLYRSVVGAYYSNQWHRFIQSHSGPGGFELFLVQDGKRAVWRIRLEKHTNYKQADEMERTERERKERHQLQSLLQYLRDRGGCCKVDEFLAEYEKKVPSKEDLPKRGDFVRFVRRYVEYFDYDSKEFVISCAQPLCSKLHAPEPPLVLITVSLGGGEPWGCTPLDDAAIFLQRPNVKVYLLSRNEWVDFHEAGPQPAVRQPSVAATRGAVYVFGGWVDDSLTVCCNTLHALELHPPLLGCCEMRGTWRSVQPTGEVPCARSMHSAVLKDDVLYVVGGRDADRPMPMNLHAYSLSANSWTLLTIEGDVPPPRYGHTARMKGDQMYIFGGSEPMDHLYVLDFRDMRWRRFPIDGRDVPSADHHVAVLCEATLHVFDSQQAWALNLNSLPLVWRAAPRTHDPDTQLLVGAMAHQSTLVTFVTEPPSTPYEPSLSFDRPLTACSLYETYGATCGSMTLEDDFDFRRPETAAPSLGSPSRLR